MALSRMKWRVPRENTRLPSRKHGFVHEEGVANELYSEYHFANGNIDKAKRHIAEARVCYEKWEAHALVDRLDATSNID